MTVTIHFSNLTAEGGVTAYRASSVKVEVLRGIGRDDADFMRKEFEDFLRLITIDEK